MMEKSDSSDIKLVMRQFLSVFALLQECGEVRILLRLVEDQRLLKAVQSPSFFITRFWDTSQLVPCVWVEFKEDKYNENTEEEEHKQGK